LTGITSWSIPPRLDTAAQENEQPLRPPGVGAGHRDAVWPAREAYGRRYEVLGLDMVRVRDGRVVEHWALRDQTAVQHQLSVGSA
jgi:hypothetical protein